MASNTEPDDDALLAELATAIRPLIVPPPEVIEAGKRLFTWRTIDTELAELAYDSLLDESPVLARSGAQTRMLTFEASGVTIELEVDRGVRDHRLVGHLVPDSEAELELVLDSGEPVIRRADELGRFALPLPPELQRVGLRVRLAGGTEVEVAPTLM